MSRQLQPTSLILAVVLIVVVLAKYAYDKGTNKAVGM